MQKALFASSALLTMTLFVPTLLVAAPEGESPVNVREKAPAAASPAPAIAPAAATDGRKQAPAFEARDLDGNRIKLADLKGKVVVIDFWATWCGPCMQELPFMDTYYKELKSKGLVVLAVATDGPETAAKISSVVKRKRFTMPVIHDAAGKIVALLNPRGNNPFTVFIDKKGRIVKSHEGYASGDEKKHKALIDQLLAEQP